MPIAKATNSTANGAKSTAKPTNSIAKTCKTKEHNKYKEGIYTYFVHTLLTLQENVS